jgi:three-Cys-motif partner protein
MLSDHDPGKWAYPPHTAAKHKILIRYMKAFLPIMGGRARGAGHGADLVIVDAFAGRGRYTTDDVGSPLLLRDIAGRVISDRRVDEIELFYIESDVDNSDSLESELKSAERLNGVIERGPIRDTFEGSAPEIIERVRTSRRSSFWFLDPFGYAGLPLTLIRSILTLQWTEIFITLMVRDMNRFLDDANHQQAIGRVLDLTGDDLLNAIEEIKREPNRRRALRDVYAERLNVRASSNRRLYVTSVHVAEDGPTDTVYYLVHATRHPKGKREMKEAIWEATGGLNEFLGANDSTVVTAQTGQIGMFGEMEIAESSVNYRELKSLLLSQFADRRIEYGKLQDEAVIGHEFDAYADRHIKTALEELAESGIIKRYRGGLPSTRRLRRGDELDFR